MQISDPRVITGTKRKLIMKDAAWEGTVISLDVLNSLALKYQVPQNAVRGLLVACGYKIPEPAASPPRIATAAEAMPATAPPAAAKSPVSTQVIDGILRGVIYKQLGEGDDAFVVTTKAQFVRERDALRKILMSGGLT